VSDDPHPVATSQRLMRPELPKRFYTTVEVAERDGGWALLLDGKGVRTPARNPLTVKHRAVADAMAAEWAAQGERVDPATMPVTRIANVAIDRVAGEMAAVRGEIARYAGSDLICYRAEGPDSLIAAQEKAWGPLIAWARTALGARLVLAGGIVHAAQDPATLAAVEAALAPHDALALAALATITTLTGSAIIALAAAAGDLAPEAAWQAAHVDEDWQAERWGRDEEAARARASRWRDMAAAALVIGAARG
jgi:chaperone required for assembly of F1-ATPase